MERNRTENQKQINIRPSKELLRDLEIYRVHMGYRSLAQTVYFLVSESLEERMREKGLKRKG